MSDRDPLAVAARLSGRPGRVLLHSGRDDDGCGMWSFLACEPVRVIRAHGREITVEDHEGGAVWTGEGDPLAILDEAIAEHCAGWPRDIAGPVPTVIGYLGYELLGRPPRLCAKMDRDRDRDSASGADAAGDGSIPDMWFGLYSAVWRHHHPGGRSDIVARDPAARRALAAAIDSGPTRWGQPPRLGALRPRIAASGR
ncbi:MAG: hypothetical protein AAGC55_23840, partial [Myxococcota bacterium]